MHQYEKWQLFNNSGEPLEGEWRSAELGNPKEGEPPVGIAVVFLYRRSENGLEFLWQRRSECVENSGLWDYSAGGHINIDETTLAAAKREAHEEIGIELDESELKFLTRIWSVNGRMLLNYYLVDWGEREDIFKFDDKEVSEVRWIKYAEMEEFRKKFAKKAVVKNDALFKTLEQWLATHGYL